jgi:ferric iron reductase protein FhuF
MIDEELLKPSREHMARLDALIAKAEREMVERIERWGKDDKEYARQQSEEYYRAVEPMRRERDAVAKVIADYYALQPMPPQVVLALLKNDT